MTLCRVFCCKKMQNMLLLRVRYAVGDIHGCFETFRELLHQLNFNTRNDSLILLGDLIDRGPHSKKIIDLVFKLQEAGADITCLRGNHEQMLLDSLLDKEADEIWKKNGGRATLHSFGVREGRQIPDHYLGFFDSMPYYLEVDNYVLVHAGLNFEDSDIFEDTHAMMWLRNYHVDDEKLGGKTLVHGHTPTAVERIQRSLNSSRVCIDRGCVYNDIHMNQLCSLNLDHHALVFQANIDND